MVTCAVGPTRATCWNCTPDPGRVGTTIRTPLTQQLRALTNQIPGPPPAAPISMERFSIPVPLIAVSPHQAPGFCEGRQFGILSPGKIVTLLPLMAVTVTVWR